MVAAQCECLCLGLYPAVAPALWLDCTQPWVGPQQRPCRSLTPGRRRLTRLPAPHTSPTFDNKLNISITLYWIKNTGEERQIAVMPPGDHRPPQSWSVYPRSGCWMAKDGAKELLRVSSTTVCQYGFQVGGQLESKNENWVPHGQPGAEEPPDPPPTANTSTATTTHNSYNTYSNKKSPTGFCGLSNQGATCYLNSLLQSLYMTPELRAALWQWEWDPSRNAAKEECIPYQLQRLFVNLYKSKDRAVSTEELTKSFGWTGSEAFAQHDVQEMFNLMSQALETTFTGTPQAQLMKSLYEGRTKDGVRCKDCGTLSARPDVYTDICLSIRQFGKPEAIKSVEEGLQNYFEQEQMDGENQYQCDKCGKKCDAEKGLACMTVPYILSLQIKRFDYGTPHIQRAHPHASSACAFCLRSAWSAFSFHGWPPLRSSCHCLADWLGCIVCRLGTRSSREAGRQSDLPDGAGHGTLSQRGRGRAAASGRAGGPGTRARGSSSRRSGQCGSSSCCSPCGGVRAGVWSGRRADQAG
jgi:hypothetical protein